MRAPMRPLVAVAMAAFAAGVVLPGLDVDALTQAVAVTWKPASLCVGEKPLLLCTDRTSYTRSQKVDAAVMNLGDEPLSGHLSAVIRDKHGDVVAPLTEADLSLAAGVTLHLDWDQRNDDGRRVARGKYHVGIGFAGESLERTITLG